MVKTVNQNILAKGSVNHLKYQLRKSKNDHFNDIQKMIELADKNEISSNIYLEDWSNGMKSSPDYIYEFIKMLSGTSIKRIMLPDTLGVLNPTMTYSYIYSVQIYIYIYMHIHICTHMNVSYLTTGSFIPS